MTNDVAAILWFWALIVSVACGWWPLTAFLVGLAIAFWLGETD